MKFTKRIVLSVLTLVITVFALGTGVFAWFTINNTASADGLTGSVESAQGGFYVSLDGKKWDTKVELSKEQHKVKGGSFTDLTSKDGVSFASLTESSSEKGFIEFDLYFLTGDSFNQINLSKLNMRSEKTTWKSEVTTDDEMFIENTLIENYVSNAARVSLQDKINPETISIFEQKVSAEGNTSGIADEKTNKAFIYYNALNGNKLNFEDATKIEGLKQAITEEDAPVLISEPIAIDNKVEVDEQLTNQGFTKYSIVTVRVWIEGWDGEAFNAIMGGELIVDFKFTATK